VSRDWVAFGGCVWFGAGGLLSLLAVLSIGPLLLVVTMAVGVPLAIRLGDRLVAAWPGLAVGAAAPLLWVAWLNRSGPGTVCHRTVTSVSCGDYWNPWPFVVVGLVLAGGGVLAFLALTDGRTGRRGDFSAT
jgi:hypothetical protein